MAKLTCSPRDSLGPSRVVINLTPMKTEMVFDCNAGSHLDTHAHTHRSIAFMNILKPQYRSQINQ